MQPVTCLRRALGTSVADVPSTRYRWPERVATHNPSSALTTQVGTSSDGKAAGSGFFHGKWWRIVIPPRLLTKFSVFEPASATKDPPLLASTPYGLASCSWGALSAVQLKSNSPTPATLFHEPLDLTESKAPASFLAASRSAAHPASPDAQWQPANACGKTPRIAISLPSRAQMPATAR